MMHLRKQVSLIVLGSLIRLTSEILYFVPKFVCMHEVLRQWHRCVHASISNAGDVSPGLDYSYTQIPKQIKVFDCSAFSYIFGSL